MKYNPDIHHRRSVRLRGYDYSGTGAYFVTLCAHERECLFGELADGIMRLNPAGEIVRALWNGLPDRFPNLTTDLSVIMPNHFHGIIMINAVGAPLAAPAFNLTGNRDDTSENRGVENQGVESNEDVASKGAASRGAASSAPTVGKIMRAFKSLSAIEINRAADRQGCPVWQRNYYERVVRDEWELEGIREYILYNPLKWDQDENNPVFGL